MSLRGAVLAVAGLCAVAGCGGDAGEMERSAELNARAAELAAVLDERDVGEPDELVVRLAFGSEADLDLYVTDPLLETVYFANKEARSGGRISGDLRCDAPAPRVEELRFEMPMPGRYRVGIDHPERCDGAAEPAAWALSVRGAGLERTAQGAIAPQEFLLVALEFELPEPAQAP